MRLARFAASDNVALAMFHGDGLAMADAAVKAGEFAVPPDTTENWGDTAFAT